MTFLQELSISGLSCRIAGTLPEPGPRANLQRLTDSGIYCPFSLSDSVSVSFAASLEYITVQSRGKVQSREITKILLAIFE